VLPSIAMPRPLFVNSTEGDVSEHGYRVIYEPLLEGGFQVIVPALTGLVSFGRTLDEARSMAQDAITCHLKGLLKDGEEIPEDPSAAGQPITEELKVTV
jgi:predicted RNase H-like HicB family nuclease